MGIPGSQEVVAAGSSAPSRVRARPVGRVARPGPEACGALAGRWGITAPGLERARVTSSAPPLAPAPPFSPRPSTPPLPGTRRVRPSTRWRLRRSRSGTSPGRPYLRLERAPEDPLKIAGTRLYLVRRIPRRPRASRPAPRRAEWRRAGVTEGNLLRYLPRAPPPGPGQPPNLVTSPASITRLACVSAARLQVLLPQPPAFEWRQCRSALLPSGRGWERTRRQGARFPRLGQLLERPLLVLGTLAC